MTNPPYPCAIPGCNRTTNTITNLEADVATRYGKPFALCSSDHGGPQHYTNFLDARNRNNEHVENEDRWIKEMKIFAPQQVCADCNNEFFSEDDDYLCPECRNKLLPTFTIRVHSEITLTGKRHEDIVSVTEFFHKNGISYSVTLEEK